VVSIYIISIDEKLMSQDTSDLQSFSMKICINRWYSNIYTVYTKKKIFSKIVFN